MENGTGKLTVQTPDEILPTETQFADDKVVAELDPEQEMKALSTLKALLLLLVTLPTS